MYSLMNSIFTIYIIIDVNQILKTNMENNLRECPYFEGLSKYLTIIIYIKQYKLNLNLNIKPDNLKKYICQI